ncbi:MAG: gas vesicle protein GvpN, partial [Chloroflexi bacterium]|nr:gas vesicle protein GvpN [Chloroflexota bacterium]
GVHKTQDALRDRMVTIDVDYFDQETEVAITEARCGIPREDAERIVALVRAYRETGLADSGPTIRCCVMIGKVLALRGAGPNAEDPVFEQTCLDVLAAEPNRPNKLARKAPRRRDAVLDLVRQHCLCETQPGIISLPRRA